ncbi:HK97 family phage prohead protease [Limnoglobus roseus]|uniref:HK97 family phage prohead protease n=1 Tax=Limnoglobus roseus TaxID=2598579 RepID=A0A5C1A466_9BACT|nr:HK97 family phage prohead protease [Limnoglobus roseus]
MRFSLDLPSWANDIKESVARGDISGMSFRFNNEKDSWEQRDGQSYRTLHDLTLHHVALVVRGAYPQAYVEVRSHTEPPAMTNMNAVWAELNYRLRKN